MTETTKPQLNPILKLAFDLGPLVLFFFANSRYGIFVATATFMVAVIATLAASYVLTRTLPIMPVVTAIIVLVFGGLTLILHNDLFIKIKPTIIYALFGAVLLGGLLFGKSFLGVVFDSLFHLTDEGWRRLTLALGAVLFRTRRSQRDRVAQHVDQRLGRLQGVRLLAADLRVRRAAISAVEKIRRRAGGCPGVGLVIASEAKQSSQTLLASSRSLIGPATSGRTRWLAPQGDGLSATTPRERLLDLGLDDRVEILRRDRSHELVGDAAVAADDESFRHAIDAPFDRGAAVLVGADGGERIAIAAEKAPGILRLVLVVDANDAKPRVAARAPRAAALRRGTARTMTPRRS